jgi:hypothetical protein
MTPQAKGHGSALERPLSDRNDGHREPGPDTPRPSRSARGGARVWGHDPESHAAAAVFPSIGTSLLGIANRS